jgi:UDP-glucuronate decarboxylase
MDYHRQNNIHIKIVRIFNTYGPRMNQNDGRVISNFIVQALKGEDITIFGDGTHTRSFQYIDDLITGMISMMNSGEEFIGPVNLGNPEEFMIAELAKKIIDMTGSGSKIVNLPLPEDDPRQRQPDITLAREKLKWSPGVNLETGLKRTIEYFRNEIALNNKRI